MTSRLDGFVFGKGKYRDVPPCEVPDAYLLAQHASLKGVPEGHEYRETFDAIVAELDARGKLPEETAKAPANAAVFRVPAPIPAAEAARRARAAANGTAVGSPEATQSPPAPRAGHSTLMPCGHPTADLKPVQGSWRGVCAGCQRLERYRMAIAGGQEPADALLAFEAEIRGYKPEDPA
jgi:hypothetical protein